MDCCILRVCFTCVSWEVIVLAGAALKLTLVSQVVSNVFQSHYKLHLSPDGFTYLLKGSGHFKIVVMFRSASISTTIAMVLWMF